MTETINEYLARIAFFTNENSQVVTPAIGEMYNNPLLLFNESNEKWNKRIWTFETIHKELFQKVEEYHYRIIQTYRYTWHSGILYIIFCSSHTSFTCVHCCVENKTNYFIMHNWKKEKRLSLSFVKLGMNKSIC